MKGVEGCETGKEIDSQSIGKKIDDMSSTSTSTASVSSLLLIQRGLITI